MTCGQMPGSWILDLANMHRQGHTHGQGVRARIPTGTLKGAAQATSKAGGPQADWEWRNKLTVARKRPLPWRTGNGEGICWSHSEGIAPGEQEMAKQVGAPRVMISRSRTENGHAWSRPHTPVSSAQQRPGDDFWWNSLATLADRVLESRL